jgi:TonB family protein
MTTFFSRFLNSLLVGLFLVSVVTAQENRPAPKQISGGVLNSKATNLVKPEYPAAARAVNAEGSVNVQVTIDENGDVISATAVSGHPLLRAASVEAARASKFSPTRLSGQSVKVSGIIVYNFAVGPMYTGKADWFNVGMMLATLAEAPTLRYFQPDYVAKWLPPDYVSEQEQIKRLAELKDIEMRNMIKSQERVIEEKTTKNKDGSVSVRRTTEATVAPSSSSAVPEYAALGQSLIASLRGRLATDPLNLWRFNLGLTVNQALLNSDSRTEEARLNSARPLRQFIETAPAEISKEVVDELQKVVSLLEKGIRNDDKVQLSQSLNKLSAMLR